MAKSIDTVPASVVPAKKKRTKPANLKGGSRKGIPNKLTRTVKEAIELAAEGLGGPTRLIEWAKEDPLNERAFWATIYPKLLPLTVAGDPNSPLVVQIMRFSDEHGQGNT